MAIKLTNKEKLDRAITDKVLSVLTNSKYTQSVKISIEAEAGSAPLIEYQIVETIIPESDGEEYDADT